MATKGAQKQSKTYADKAEAAPSKKVDVAETPVRPKLNLFMDYGDFFNLRAVSQCHRKVAADLQRVGLQDLFHA